MPINPGRIKKGKKSASMLMETTYQYHCIGPPFCQGFIAESGFEVVNFLMISQRFILTHSRCYPKLFGVHGCCSTSNIASARFKAPDFPSCISPACARVLKVTAPKRVDAKAEIGRVRSGDSLD